jgi:hypothetical protein
MSVLCSKCREAKDKIKMKFAGGSELEKLCPKLCLLGPLTARPIAKVLIVALNRHVRDPYHSDVNQLHLMRVVCGLKNLCTKI